MGSTHRSIPGRVVVGVDGAQQQAVVVHILLSVAEYRQVVLYRQPEAGDDLQMDCGVSAAHSVLRPCRPTLRIDDLRLLRSIVASCMMLVMTGHQLIV